MTISGPYVIAAVAAILLFLIIQQWRRGRPSKADLPECTPEIAWDHYLKNGGQWSPRDRSAIEALTHDRLGDAGGIRARLESVIEDALRDEKPLVPLRSAIMDATDRFVMLERLASSPTTPASGDDSQPPQLAAAESVLEAGALRSYSKLRFADFSDNDWYTHYLRLTEMHATNVAAMVQATVEGHPASIETSLHEPLTRAMARARKVLIHHPRQEAVDKSTRLDEASGIRALTPSPSQVEDLAALMKRHFEDLFTAKIYGIGDSNPASPAAAVHVDAVLLYGMLDLQFSQSSRAWRQIMEIALGGDAEALHGEEELLRCANRATQAWRDHDGTGSFNAAIAVACQDAVASTDPSHAVPLASSMNEEVRQLARAIRAIVERPSDSEQS